MIKTIDYWIQIKKIPACFGKYNYRIADCQRQDLGICAVCESYTKLENTLIDYKDKLHRRNMQIKELKKQLQDVIPTSALSWKCFTCGQVYKFSTLEPLKNIIPSCFCNKPDCRIIINR